MEVISNESLPIWFDYVESITSYTLMISAFITISLYWLEITILFTLRQTFYKGMFYRIFTIGITIDMIALVNNYVGCVFPAKGWFINYYLAFGTKVGHIYLIIAWTSRGIQGCTVVALALNRATAVCLPVTHKRIWNSRWAPLVHIVQLGVGFAIGSRLLSQSFYWKHENKGYYIQFMDKKFRLNFFIAAYVLETVFVVLIIVINITMMVWFKKRYRMKSMSSTRSLNFNHKVLTEKQRQENNLTIVAVVTCVAELIYYIYVIYSFGINTNVPTRVFYLGYNVINDIYCGLSGWLLLIYSPPMRRHIRKMLRFSMFRCRKHKMIEIHGSTTTNHNDFNMRNTSARRVHSYGTQF